MGQTDRTERDSLHRLFTGWWGIAVGLFTAFAIAVGAANAIDNLRWTGLFGAGALGDRGYTSEHVVGQPGWERITGIATDGADARAGLAPGMLIHFDHPHEAQAHLAGGRSFGAIVIRDGQNPGRKGRHLALITRPLDFAAEPLAVRFTNSLPVLTLWFALVLGMIAVVRGWGSLAALTFGFGMLGLCADTTVPPWATGPVAAAGMLFASAITNAGVAGLFLFPAALYAERVNRPARAWMIAFAVIVAMCVALFLFYAWCMLRDVSYPLVGNGAPIRDALLFMFTAQALYWCWRGWRDSTGADRGRFAAIFAATACQMLYILLEIALALTASSHNAPMGAALTIILQLFFNVLIPLTIACAVLCNRVIDIGFALNRAVVYGSFSAILLASFGLIDWAIEHLLPEPWVKASAWIDAGAAVLVYLAFHRVRDVVEQRVEHLFFRHWQRNEDTLRRFVGLAAHFEDDRALARAFVDELTRFGGGARVAVYRREAAVLDRVAGTWDAAPRHFRADGPAFALMRAERAPLDLGETRTDLPGVLALPMLDHGVLAGLVLMDLKGNGALYRPDEVAQLGHAAHEVGLALAALHAGLIETENRLLKAQLARLGSIIGDRLDRAGA